MTTQRLGLPMTFVLMLAPMLAAADPEPDMVTRQAVCRWAAKPPVLDGKLDDPCWKNAAVIDRFASFWNKDPPGRHPRVPGLG